MEKQLKALKKEVKSKDKEAHNLDKKIGILQDINTKLKSEISEIKSLKLSLDYEAKKLKQKLLKFGSKEMKQTVASQTITTVDTSWYVQYPLASDLNL